MKESYELLQEGNPIAIAVVIAAVVVALVKGFFAMNKDRSQARKEFIESWSKAQGEKDGFLLEMVVRHGFGTYMPAELIRLVSASYLGSQAVARISSEWKWFEFDRNERKIAWKKSFRAKPWVPVAEQVVGFVLYIVMGMIGVVTILSNMGSVPLVAIASAVCVVAVVLLIHAFSIGEATGVWKLICGIGLAKEVVDAPPSRGSRPNAAIGPTQLRFRRRRPLPPRIRSRKQFSRLPKP